MSTTTRRSRREKAQLKTRKPGKFDRPNLVQVYDCLAGEINTYAASYKESDGKIRDPGALHTINCLTLAAAIVINQLYEQRSCVWCGCTESRACRGGCSWMIQHPATNTGVCSACWPKEVGTVDRLEMARV